jgi:hypothetical protein
MGFVDDEEIERIPERSRYQPPERGEGNDDQQQIDRTM